MKYSILLLLASLSLMTGLFSCDKKETTSGPGRTDIAWVGGEDYHFCACCGGRYITFSDTDFTKPEWPNSWHRAVNTEDIEMLKDIPPGGRVVLTWQTIGTCASEPLIDVIAVKPI